MIGLLIIVALVAVPLALVARQSLLVLARLFGVVSRSEVVTRLEFERIREQMLSSAPPASAPEPAGEAIVAMTPAEPTPRGWRECPECLSSVSSAARICVHCGRALGVPA